MSRKKNKKQPRGKLIEPLHPDIRRSVLVVLFLGLAAIFLLAGVGQAGPWGEAVYQSLNKLFGWGYYLFPVVFFLLAFSFISEEKKIPVGITLIGDVLFVVSGLGLIDVIAPGDGGLIGEAIGALKIPFGVPASLVIMLTILVASFIVAINRPISFSFPKLFEREDGEFEEEEEIEATVTEPVPAETGGEKPKKEEKKKEETESEDHEEKYLENESKRKLSEKMRPIKNYIAPPLSLLSSVIEKPTIGDLRANANVIKRTLESFGVSVEMGEINVGPTVTRYTLKPAEGTRLARITALHQDLALALAAHPIRIEAPIPGKSLVGIEVPNKAAAVVRLGSLLLYPEFQKSEPLTFSIGRNVSGEPVFADIAKMPHLLIAGATGSGKSISIHSVIISLLFKNSPDMLRLLLIDPKRVELSVYKGIPHLLSPVITENKKALGVLRWAIKEMDRRYEFLLESGSRDIKSYHKNHKDLPYILIVIDELADLMATYGREVEGSIIRLAQMARATGIHLVVSTQRPSVEVITGLIKANITSRIALQVASQVDSRTILDTSGAEKLLGHGDLLFISAEISKPKRIQGAFITEEEIKIVASFIRDNNESAPQENVSSATLEEANERDLMELDFDNLPSDDDDDLYEEAVEVVREAKKASASFLQRRLKVGYARAARLLDIMEERGVVGPGEGAKPREVFGIEEDEGFGRE